MLDLVSGQLCWHDLAHSMAATRFPPLRLELERIQDWDLKLPKVPFISSCDYEPVDTPSSGNHRIFRVRT